jgi:hypothetical protein
MDPRENNTRLKDYRGPKNKKKPKHHKNIAGSTY